MHTLYLSAKFKKDYKKLKRNADFKREELEKVLNVLASGNALEYKYQNHKLTGDFADCYECHVQPDVLLVYTTNKEKLRIELIRLGSHAELF